MSEEQSSNTATDSSLGLYFIVSAVLCLIIVIPMKQFPTSSFHYFPGVIGKIFMFILGVPGGTLGMVLGRKIRDAIQPDAIYYQKTSELVWSRIFWSIGPQSIGLIIGLAIGMLIVAWIAS